MAKKIEVLKKDEFKKESPIKLHHFGEFLIETLIKALTPVRFQFFLKNFGFRPGQVKLGINDPPFNLEGLETTTFAKLVSKDQ